MAEARAIVYKRMEFAVFATGIDLGRQVGEELGIEIAASEFRGQNFRVHTGDFSAQAGSDHGPGQIGGGDLPDRKQGLEAGAGELLFAVGANVGEEQVAESHGVHLPGYGAGAEVAHASFVLLVGTGPGQGNGPERQADGLRLQLQKLAPDGVHGHAIELFVQSGD